MIDERSLNDDATSAGVAKRRPAPESSVGDERTLGDGFSAQDTILDDMEVVDLDSRYRIDGELGQGGMGAVLLATDTRLDRKVAIKRILGESAVNRMAVNRFLTEAKSIAALNHPNIVQIYDYGRAKDGPFLIMEFVDGGSLLDRCVDGAMPPESAVDIACQLCDGLGKAHDLGIIHRDIKPANILLTKDGVPKLTDFGLAKAQAGDDGQTMTGAVLGTPDFMPPEQRRDASLVDHRSDLWSLAATIYQMVTGRSPKIIRFDLLPADFTKVLGKALEDAKDDRYQTARELRDSLKGIGGGGQEPTATRVEGVLHEGQCKACGTVTSDLTKKFCRNPQCGASMRVACLKCAAQMPVWDGVCGECGGNQPALLKAKRNLLESKRAKAEALLADLAFDEAIGLANEAASDSRAELVDLVDWTPAFVAAATAERDRQRGTAAERVQDARKHVAAWDYPAAIQSLEMIPHRLRNAATSLLLSDCQRLREESEKLLAEIASRIGRKKIDGLLPLVQRAAGLRGDRADLAKIRQQLTERRDVRLVRGRAAMASGDVKAAAEALSGALVEDLGPEGGRLLEEVERRQKQEQACDDALKQATDLVDQHDYKAAVAALATVAPEAMTTAVTELRERAGSLASTADELAASIRKAEKAGTLAGSLAEINQYLELKPGDARVAALRQAVVARQQAIESERQSLASHAGQLLAEYRYQEAAKCLEGMSPDVETPSLRQFQKEAQAAVTEMEQLRKQIQDAVGLAFLANFAADSFVLDKTVRVEGLLDIVKAYLRLNPKDDEVQSILQWLTAREENIAKAFARFCAHINGLLETGKWQEALFAIEKERLRPKEKSACRQMLQEAGYLEQMERMDASTAKKRRNEDVSKVWAALAFGVPACVLVFSTIVLLLFVTVVYFVPSIVVLQSARAWSSAIGLGAVAALTAAWFGYLIPSLRVPGQITACGVGYGVIVMLGGDRVLQLGFIIGCGGSCFLSTMFLLPFMFSVLESLKIVSRQIGDAECPRCGATTRLMATSGKCGSCKASRFE